jgi:hypothetical protein
MSAANGKVIKGEDLKFDVGLISAVSKKYLTTELGTVNVNGTSLKSKQVWTLTPADDKLFYLSNKVAKSDKITVYRLAHDKTGSTVTAERMDEDTTSELKQKFRIEPLGDGKFAIKSATHDYLSASKLSCQSKTVGADETWSIQLAIHPQVNIFSVQRQRFAHLDSERDMIVFNEGIPWGGNAVLTLIWDAGASQYLIQAADDRFVTVDGSLTLDKSNDALFSLEFHGESIAFKNGGKYLSVGGTDGELKTRKATLGIESLFRLEDSYPQGVFYSIGNSNKLVSWKQGGSILLYKPHAPPLSYPLHTYNQFYKKKNFRL